MVNPVSLHQQQIDQMVREVPGLLAKAYGSQLLAVVLFGSVARGEANQYSDIDLLIILRERQFESRDDHQGCDQVQIALSSAIDNSPELQFHLRSAAEAEQGGPIFLDISVDGIILFDPDGWASEFLQRYRDRLAAQGSERIPWGDNWYWRLTPTVRPAAEVWFWQAPN